MIRKKISSKFNNEIALVQTDDEYRVMVNGFVESGLEVEEIWTQAFEKLIPADEKVNNVLILGFATGSVVKLIKKSWPNSKITAVEIDPVMIEIAREYFPENLKDVDIKNLDAVEFIESLPQKLSFDLVIMDCYLNGHVQPENTKTIDFLLKLKKIGKYILMNQLILPNSEDRMKKVEFLRDLNQSYPVKIFRLPFNVMIEF